MTHTRPPARQPKPASAGETPPRAESGVDAVLAHAPHRIAKVALTVRDLDRVARFYGDVIGLQRLEEDADKVGLGGGGGVLLELRRDPQARLSTRGEAGLFHTAFLLPARAELGAWLAFAARTGVPLTGASDHLVSEALYLTDPEGNGIELYADRPSAEWPRSGAAVRMVSDPLDLQGLMDAAGRTWSGFPTAGVVGHVHLQVGEIAPAEAFYGGLLGLDVTCRYPGGSFYGSGGYHHQLATNTWNSRGAPVRSDRATGLAEVEILADPTILAAVRAKAPVEALGAASPGSLSLRDPWGASITLRAS